MILILPIAASLLSIWCGLFVWHRLTRDAMSRYLGDRRAMNHATRLSTLIGILIALVLLGAIWL